MVEMVTFFINFNIKLLIKIIFSLCLLYQTYLLIQQFFKFNLVINIKLSENVINSLPAITICYNRLYSFEKLVQYYPDYRDIYENYTKFSSKYSNYEYFENSSTLFLDENKFFIQNYWKIINDNDLSIPDVYSYNNLSPEEIFHNLTLGLEKPYSPNLRYYESTIV